MRCGVISVGSVQREALLHCTVRPDLKMEISALGASTSFTRTSACNFISGLGINGAFVHVHNHSHYVKRNVRKEGVGGVVKMGLYFEPRDDLFFELFSDYLYQRIHFKKNVQIGGVKIGGGIGFSF